MAALTPTLRVHPRVCDLCEYVAENPFRVFYDAKINERVTLCSQSCLDQYTACREKAFTTDDIEIIFNKIIELKDITSRARRRSI